MYHDTKLIQMWTAPSCDSVSMNVRNVESGVLTHGNKFQFINIKCEIVATHLHLLGHVLLSV